MRRRNTQEQFWSKVDKTGECWTWTGTRNRQGYGVFHFDHEASAHRVSYKIANGPIPYDMVICHKCDNPPCVRPDHLWVGTYKQNAQDMVAKGRGRPGKPKSKPPLVSGSTELKAHTVTNQAGDIEIYLCDENGVSKRYTRDGALGEALLLLEACRKYEVWTSPWESAGEIAHPTIPPFEDDENGCKWACNFCLFRGTISDGVPDCPCPACKEEFERLTALKAEEAEQDTFVPVFDEKPVPVPAVPPGFPPVHLTSEPVPPLTPDPIIFLNTAYKGWPVEIAKSYAVRSQG